MSKVFNQADAHDKLTSAVLNAINSSQFEDIPLYGNNGPQPKMDEETRFVHFDIVFTNSEQVTLGADPIDRTWGSVEFMFATKEGKGVRALRVMASEVKESMKAKSFGAVKTLIPSPGRSRNENGWIIETLYVPFYFDGLPIAMSTG